MTAAQASGSVVPIASWNSTGRPAGVPGVHRAGRARRQRGLVLDLDDTLYPRRRFVQSGFGAVAAHLATTEGVAADQVYQQLIDCLTRGEERTAFQAVCAARGLDAGLVPTLVDVFRAHEPRIFLGRGARQMLQTLRASGWRLAILTNGLPTVQAKKVNALGLGELVDHVVFAEEVVRGGKPARAAFTTTLQRLGTRSHQTVCVGDDPRADIIGARDAGIATIRLAVPGFDVDPTRDADVVVETLDDVPRMAAALLEGATRHAA